MSKELCERIISELPEVNDDWIDLTIKGELTMDEYMRILSANAKYIDPTTGSLSEIR